MAESEIITVDSAGDVVLHFQDLKAQVDQQFRCSRKILGQKSRFFDVLFDPHKFSEGKEAEKSLHTLLEYNKDVMLIPSAYLPKITIRDVGDVSAAESERLATLQLLLQVLHCTESQIILKKWEFANQMILRRIAMLVIYAEQFAVEEVIRDYIRNRQKFQYNERYDQEGPSPKMVEACKRQKLLVGMFLDNDRWVTQSCGALIQRGSERWADDFVSSDGSLWDRLPHGLEEELQCRREYVLDTITSLMTHFIHLYSSKQQQCKLGYDTSPQCDTFQLGEMVKFFTRKGLSRLQSTFCPSQGQDEGTEDISNILEKLKQCPSYQLDAHHRHCGLRARILPLLAFIASYREWGFCRECWKTDQQEESWVTNPTEGTWYFNDASPQSQKTMKPYCNIHQKLKAMFTAERREWTSTRPSSQRS